jgi:thymidylate synthase
MSIDNIYADLGFELLNCGEKKLGRNGNTISLFGTSLKYDMSNGFPILSMRKIFYKGIVGEFVSFLQDAKTVEGFEANGCNYWKLWADANGTLKLDYPPREQLDYVLNLIKTEPTSRRIIIDLWNPSSRGKLSLDPCHTQYQFSVRKGFLDMIWTQRSVDYAVGAPSDFILAALYNITIANECGLLPGIITFNFGDTHLYEEHIDDFSEMLRLYEIQAMQKTYVNPKVFCILKSHKVKDFNKDSLELTNYYPNETIKFLLKA